MTDVKRYGKASTDAEFSVVTDKLIQGGFGETRIKNCGRLFRFRCPREWTTLDPTEDPKVRYCGVCKQNVHLCYTKEELQNHKGECAALAEITFMMGGVK